jgi:hypothetical protein
MVTLFSPEVIELIADAIFDDFGKPIQEGAFAGLLERQDILETCQQGVLHDIPGLQLAPQLGTEPGADGRQNPHQVAVVKLVQGTPVPGLNALEKGLRRGRLRHGFAGAGISPVRTGIGHSSEKPDSSVRFPAVCRFLHWRTVT